MSTLVENVEKVKSASCALRASIEAKGVSVPADTKLTGMPALVDQIQTGSGFTEDTTTLSVAFGGLAKKITPKDVISFSSLTWQGERHELGSKDYGVFDGNFLLDEAFWPAKPLPGYLYVQIDGIQGTDSSNTFYLDFNNLSYGNVDVVNNQITKIPEDVTGISLRNIRVENYGSHDYIYTIIIYDCVNSAYYIIDESRELPIIAVDMDHSRYAFFIFVRCVQFTTLLFLNSSDNIYLQVDNYTYNSISGKFFIPVYDSFMTTNSNVYIRYINTNKELVDKELLVGNTYFLREMGNPNIIYIGNFAS